MNGFTYARADDVATALREIGSGDGAKFVAGGTNLIDLMKERVERPKRLVDISHLPLAAIEPTLDGGLRIGALATNADAAYHPAVVERYPLVSAALLAGASPQLRNMATIGGNLLQRTRCVYFYDLATPCNKRAPGTGCAAIGGVNRGHAILGASEHCVATHPSDLCVALAALDAVVEVTGPRGDRAIPFGELHRLPGDTPHIDTNLAADELITAVVLPERGFAANCAYLKVRERASYAFALVSVAAVLELDGGRVADARVALGGVAHKPWRDPSAERLLRGRPARQEEFATVADALLRDARALRDNGFKIGLARRAIVRALDDAASKSLARPRGTPR